MDMQFTLAEEPTPQEVEAARVFFAGETDFLKGVVAMDGMPMADRMEVCFAGRSNVGKSSLINALTGRKGLARASNTPGRTQEINFFTLTESHYLVDLPGYGFANAPIPIVEKWQRLLKAYLSGRASLRRAFVLIDARHGVKPVDEEIMTLLDKSAVTFQCVLTKTDKVKGGAKDKMLEQVKSKLAKHPASYPEIIMTSSEKGDGIATCGTSFTPSPNLTLAGITFPSTNKRQEDTDMKKQNAMKSDWIATASTLSKALPYLQRYDDAIVVIKFGGHAMGSDEAMESFARDIVLLRQVGVNPVIVHGGGPMINEMLDKLSIQSDFVNGKRVTDEATVEVVEMVLSGRVNKKIVQAINAQGGKAVGLSGKDAGLITCTQTNPDLGFVGTPSEIDTSVLHTLFEAGTIPVIAPLGAGANGETFNINGDTAAGAIAAALKADRLLLLTDVAGVKDASGEVVTDITADQIRELTKEGVIAGGMIPKTETALAAIEGGVRAVVILDGRAPNACLLELFTDHGAGSIIRR